MKKWIKAARLRTLPLSVSGIILGMAVAYPKAHTNGNFYVIFILCLLTTLFLQVLSNYANDYGDAIKGTDNEHRVGPKRAIQSGEISATAMKKAIIITSILSVVSSILVIYFSFGTEKFLQAFIYLFLGIVSVVAAIKYTVGQNAYGYQGLGDVFVFLFFGLLSTVGSYYLYTHELNGKIFLPAIAIGLLSTAVLNMNNMRDIENDARMQKNTLVVKMGFHRAKVYHFLLITIAIIALNTYAIIENFKGIYYFYIIGFIPLLKNLKKVQNTTIPKELDSELKRLALSTFFISILISIAVIIK